MAYRLNPQYPLLWRDPHTMQIGYDRAIVVLNNLAHGYWYVLEALRSGIGLSGLRLLATEYNISPAELNTFLLDLSPALIGGEAIAAAAEKLPELPDEPAPASPLRLDFSGNSSLISQFDNRIHQAHPARAGQPPQLVILCERYLIPPELWQPSLQAGLVHLPVVFGDQSITIGPLVLPGTGPCLYCQYLWQAEEQPWLSTLYSQTHQVSARRQQHGGALHSGSLHSEHGALLWTAIAELSWLVESYRYGFPQVAESTQFFDTGEVIRKAWQRHPDCYCAGVFAENAKAA